MIGTTLAHFRITAALGAGGMGEVWRATDEKLGREVALKVLSEEFADNAERLDRFEREARAVAALNHPHIVTIYSVEEAESTRFLTMELIEGRSLDKLIPEGGLGLGDFFKLATPLAEAISAAHDKSVVHRDLKPSNVMVDGDGRIKVLDFGLAKLQEPGEPSDSTELPTAALTGVGTIVGTVPYMSPEQIEGKIVDHRTDIFSLGVLLYEMAIGERPFHGSSSPGLMSSILKDAPKSVVEIRDDLPRHLGRIIGRCLEKDRRDRYQTARDVFNELRALRQEASLAADVKGAAGNQGQSDRLSNSSADAPSRHRSSADASALDQGNEDFWIAVLPFQSRASDSSVDALAEGLTEDLITGLSRFSYLQVISRSSTSRYGGAALDVRAVGRELGARYVMEGSIRQVGSVLRVTTQLVNADTGSHLWAETYNRPFSPGKIFDLQDDLAPRIVANVADPYGALVRSMAVRTASKTPHEMTPFEAVLRSFLYLQRVTAEDHLQACTAVEHAVEVAPENADAWACLALLELDEYRHAFNPRPDALDRALRTVHRSINIDPGNQLGHANLAQIQFYRRDLWAFRAAAEKAIALNPGDGNTLADLGLKFVYSGDWDRGLDLTRAAIELNPHHPGWYRFGEFLDHYREGRYAEALSVAEKVNLPGYYWHHLMLAVAHAQLRHDESSRDAVVKLLRLCPDFGKTGREDLEKTLYAQPALVDHLLEGLCKAGLKVQGAKRPSVELEGGEKHASDPVGGPVAIAVLPFSDLSPDKDQDYFCEGMAEEIMNALVPVDGIRVASRTSSFKAVEQDGDLRSIGRTLNVGQILEGSVRMAGNRLRVTAQLTEVESGYQLWSERFDREAEDVFAIQDEIAAGVVEAVEARLAPGVRTIVARPQAHNLEAYRSYLLGQHLRYAKEDHGGAVRAFQEAVRLDPTYAPSWTGLAESLALSAHMSLIPAHEACAAARKALSRALELQGESADGLHGEAFVAFIERRWTALEAAVRRAIELQPSHVPSLGLLGMSLCLHQKPDEAELFFERARQADPLASFPYMLTALGLLTVRRPQDAHPYAEQALTFEKEDASALFCSSLANIALGHFEEGIEAAEHGVAVSHRGADFLGLLGWALATAGQKDEARTLLEELRARPAAAPPIVSEGWLLGALGEIDAAFEVLVRAENECQLWLYYTGLPGFDPLRSDSRFPAFVERLGLPPSPSASIAAESSDQGAIIEKSIAVLPFTNMSADPENEYFSDGLSEEIINALTRLPGLRVIARTSAFRFRGEQDLRKVGAALGVETLLEGSVRKAGQKLRITAQLIDVADDSHIWSERFDRDLVDVFAIQDEISAAIVEKLHVSLGASEPARRQTANVAAYEALLEGRHHFSQFTPESTERALVCFRRALTLDPEYPDALTFYAFYHLTMAYMFENPRKMLPSTREFGERALQVDPHHGEAQAAVAVVSVVLDHDWSAAELLFQQALEAAPASARVHELYGLCWLLGQGRFDQALAELDLAIKLDPLSALYAGNRGRVLTCSRRFAEAQESCRRGLTLDSRQLLVQVELTYALLFDGKFEEAIAVGERAIGTHGPVNAPCQALALSYALAGRRDEAFDLVKKTARPGAGYRSPLALGLVHAAFSEMDAAFACVEQSFEERDPLLMYLAVHPMFDTLRSDPRYPDLLQRMNLHEGSRP